MDTTIHMKRKNKKDKSTTFGWTLLENKPGSLVRLLSYGAQPFWCSNTF